MQASSILIDTFISQIEESTILSKTCETIRAYEGSNLPVPIKKTYFSFSAEENKVTYSLDENGNKIETNDVIIRMNCFTPLSSSPAVVHVLAEAILVFIALSNSSVTGFTAGQTEYDSDIDAYKIVCRINLSVTEKVTAQ